MLYSYVRHKYGVGGSGTHTQTHTHTHTQTHSSNLKSSQVNPPLHPPPSSPLAGLRPPAAGVCRRRGLLGRPRHAPAAGRPAPVVAAATGPVPRPVRRAAAGGGRAGRLPAGPAPQPEAAAGQGALERPGAEG